MEEVEEYWGKSPFFICLYYEKVITFEQAGSTFSQKIAAKSDNFVLLYTNSGKT
ncbi:hypothetical protein IQ270_01335 [Microcoleus sp. LEGE 07076]|uniref:hypothetical protein n=1 Tax=Microcoleus sp. LEGE 07076 TaxID=915322 RepID=UPI0018814E19|nr:hypothetical protein [Microcoleus sp. LEGE 07076]MBE9183401.1 hypothetical protein [Microcoleus sp. LEGE 07076]